MKFNKIVACCFVLASVSGTSFAQNAKGKKIIDAVMGAYATELAKTPNDYNLLFARANQYFINGDYLNALEDINAALKYTTRDDTELLFEEYMLRAKIYNLRGEYNNMANDAISALRIMPTSLPALFLSGEANYNIENYTEAKAAYQNILKQNNLNYDALAGLAKVAVKEKNIGQAREYSDKAVALYPAQAAVYVNRADILSMLGEDNAAAHDLLQAITLDYEKSGALQKLVDMSNTNYPVVIDALNDAIQKVPNSGLLLYIRSIIALDHNNFSDAIKDINHLIDNKIYTNDGIYYDQATALYNLGKYNEAIQAIRNAIIANADAGAYYVLHSKILQQLGKTKDALTTVQSTLNVEPSDVEALIQKASILNATNKKKEAIATLNEAIMNNPEVPYAYLMRANIKKSLKDTQGATEDYKRIIAMNDRSLKSYRGFALHNLGRDSEAKTWIEDAVAKNKVGGGEMYFLAASLYAQCGDAVTALDYLEGALANGYGSIHKIANSDDASIDLTTLKTNPRYTSLLTQYKSNF